MGALSKTLLAAALIILIFIFIPKYTGGGAICFGCEEQMTCECFGAQKEWNMLGSQQEMCIGVPHNCQPLAPAEDEEEQG